MEDPSRSARDGMASVTFGTLLMLLGTLGFVAQGFVSRVILARSLSTIDWGIFSLGLALVGLLSSIGTLGLPQAIARSLPLAPADPERRSIVRSALVGTVLAAVLLSAALFVFGLYLGSAYDSPGLALTTELFALSVGLSIVSSILASVFQGYEDVVPNALFLQVVNPALFIVFLVGSIRFAARSQVFAAALISYPAAGAVTLIALVLYSRGRLRKRLPAGPRAPGVARRLYLFAVPLFLVSVTGFATGNGDTLILGIFHQASVGYYTAGLSMARLVLVGVGALSYIFLPVAARYYHQQDREAIRLTYVTATKWMLLVSLPLFVVFFFLPGPSLTLVYGSQYTPASRALQILVVGSFVSTLAGPAPSAQVALGQTRLLLGNNIATGALNLLLSFLLIPSMGIAGAAIAWSASNALNPLLSVVEIALLEGIHPVRSHYLLPVVGTAAPFFAYFLAVPSNPALWLLPVAVLIVALVFVLVVLLTGSVDRGDRLVLEVIEGMTGRPLSTFRRIGNWRLRHHLFGRGHRSGAFPLADGPGPEPDSPHVPSRTGGPETRTERLR